MAKRFMTETDILPMAEYVKGRADWRSKVTAKKRNRRVDVGPHITFYFECYDTMWLQVQEMLYIEKGGAEQIPGELEAYNPLIPNGSELTATFMIEIDDPGLRARTLNGLGRIEEVRVYSRGWRNDPRRARSGRRSHDGVWQGVVGAVRAFPVHAGSDRGVRFGQS